MDDSKYFIDSASNIKLNSEYKPEVRVFVTKSVRYSFNQWHGSFYYKLLRQHHRQGMSRLYTEIAVDVYLHWKSNCK